ncbi:MAG TPA: hypothetical protein DCE11_05435 [Ruminiclostridium sp.]|nr:hypothetical protein [Ruminiclostridium sp.]
MYFRRSKKAAKISELTKRTAVRARDISHIPCNDNTGWFIMDIDDNPAVKFLNRHMAHFALAGFMLLCFYPIFSCWYYGDDVVSRNIHTVMQYENRSLYGFMANQMDYYIVKLGRFFPAHIIQRFLTFYFLNTITKYRIYILVMNILAVFCFAHMAKAYSGSDRLFYAVLILFPALFFCLSRQDDPTIGYYMFIQTLVIYLSVSLILMKKYRDTGKKGYLALSAILYIISLLTYESSYPIVLVYPLAAFHLFDDTGADRLKKTVRVSIPYVAAAVCCFIVYIYFSMNAVHSYDGINFNPDIRKITVTSIKQTAAALPGFSSLILYTGTKLSSFLNSFKSGITFLDIATAAVFAYLLPVLVVNKKKVNLKLSGTKFLIGLSFLLIACPAFITGISRKYQQNLQWGDGYLTIYIIRFGFVLLLILLYEFILGHIKRNAVKTVFIALTVLLALFLHLFVMQENRKVLQYKNQTTYLRLVAEKAIDAGLLKNMPEQSVILLGNIWYDYPSFTRNSIFSGYCGSRVTTDTMRNFIDESWKKHAEEKTYNYDNEHAYYFHSCKYLSNTGYAFSGKLKTLSVDNANIIQMHATDFRLFYSGDECEAVSLRVFDNNGFISKRIPLVKHGPGYTAEINGLVDMLSIELIGKVKPSIWQE